MTKSFSIPRANVVDADPSRLLAEIVRASGSEADAASILRSLERVGTDATICFYEVTQVKRGPRLGGVATTAWRVRADRGAPKVSPLEAAAEEQPS